MESYCEDLLEGIEVSAWKMYNIFLGRSGKPKFRGFSSELFTDHLYLIFMTKEDDDDYGKSTYWELVNFIKQPKTSAGSDFIGFGRFLSNYFKEVIIQLLGLMYQNFFIIFLWFIKF